MRLECERCRRPEYLNSKPCAEALVVRDGSVLLVKRNIEPFRGYWDIPGGFLEDGEQPEDGVRREVLEEAGLDVRVLSLLGVYGEAYPGPEKINTLTFTYIAEPLGEPKALDESEEVRFFPADRIPERLAFDHARRAIGDWQRLVRTDPAG